MQPYVATKQWKDGFGAGETRITASDLTRIEAGISAATQGVTNLEGRVTTLDSTMTTKIQQAQTAATDAASALLPVGTIVMYAGTTLPTGWVACNGQLLERNTYQKLFQILGTAYGNTTNSNFRVPDIRNRFPVGAGDAYSVGTTGGVATVALTVAQMPSHTHGVTAEKFSQGVGLYQSNLGAGSGWQSLSTTEAGSSSALVTKAVGGGQAHENRPPFMAFTFIIKVS